MAQKVIKRKSATKSKYGSSAGLSALVKEVENLSIRTDFPIFKAGDTVKVHTRIQEGEKERIQAYEGVVVAIRNRGVGKSFVVRKISHGVGVERVFLFSSPKVAKVDVVQSGRVRRAKMYYLKGLQGKAARIERDGQQAAGDTKAKDGSLKN